MDNTTKTCPQCAETIQLEAKLCRFCGARFEIKTVGYCSNCHEMRGADENGHCAVCGSELMDSHIESILIPKSASKPQPIPAPINTVQFKPAKKRNVWAWILGFLIVIAGICIVGGVLLKSRSTATVSEPTKTRPTPIVPPTKKPPTPIPTRTATPSPVAITFDSIGTYPEGRLVILSGILEMFKSTWCGNECGLALSEYTNSSNSITIFVRVAAKGVEPSRNQMKALPNPFSKWDVVVCLNDGTLAYIDNRITVTGRVCKTTGGDPCISDIIKIEKEK